MLDQEVFGQAMWKQCQGRHAELLDAAATCRVLRQAQNHRHRPGSLLGRRLGDLLISAGLKLGGQVQVVSPSSTLVAYR